MSETARHIPVLIDEVILALAPSPDRLYLDGTFGLGGYSRRILETGASVIAIDRDPAAIAAGETIAATAPGRLTLIDGRFGDLEHLLTEIGIDSVDGVALDLGVSSPQLDDPARGFSFRGDGPLDMRMGGDGPDAAEIVNHFAEADLANLIWRFGEERLSRRVARAIVEARRDTPIERTTALARIVRSAVPASRDGIDPATRTFQALRIYVNDELGELARGLVAAERILRAGGRLAIVSFHSLEDRIVKAFFRQRAGLTPQGSRHAPAPSTDAAEPSFHLLSRKPVLASPAEIARNPRARSAKLRVAERTTASPWSTPFGVEEAA